MSFDRRSLLAFSGYALAAQMLPLGRAMAADIASLLLVQPFGKLSMALAAFDLLSAPLHRELNCEVAVRTVTGNDGFDAIDAILTPQGSETRLVGSAVMGPQYVETIVPQKVRIEKLTPIVKLTNGYSVALFTKRGGPLKGWSDLAGVKPLTVSSLERGTAAFVAELMMEHKGGLAVEVKMHKTIPDIVDDVMAGRSAAGIITTTLVTGQLNRLQPIATFGAQRNAVLTETPTFAEIVGNTKLAFTESIGVFGPPGMATSTVERLTKAFATAAKDPGVVEGAKAAKVPLVINGPDVLVGTMERNQRVLKRILG